MNLNRERLNTLAGICHIALAEEEAERLIVELNGLLQLAELLPPATGEIAGAGDRPAEALRADEVRQGLSQTEALSSANTTQNGFFCVARAVGDAS